MKQNLDELVDQQRFIVVAPNGRQDDLGLPYWISSDDFNGNFEWKRDPRSVGMKEIIKWDQAPDEMWPVSLKKKKSLGF